MIRAIFYDKISKQISFKKQGDNVIIINKSNNKPFGSDYIKYFSEKKYEKVFSVEDDLLVLRAPINFYAHPETIGERVNKEILEEYNRAENKMILTGRVEKLRKDIEKRLKDLKIEYPNFGLELFSGFQNVREFKTQTILKTIKENNWKEVHYYEDRADWLYYAEGVVKKTYPEVKFLTHLVVKK